MRSLGPTAVIGGGSIGRRHLRNLRALGADQLFVVDSDRARAGQASDESGASIVSSVDALPAIDAAFVCTPTSCHLESAAAAILKGAHVYIEKPISDSTEGVAEMLALAKQNGRLVMVGFNLRFHPCLQTLRKVVEEGLIGRILGARIEFGQYLPDWHPWEDYRLGYSANRILGGGILLDATHEFDYARWLLGEVESVSGRSLNTATLSINTEDLASFVMQHSSGAISELHVDYLQRVYSRNCKLIGTEGTAVWDWDAKGVRIFDANQKRWDFVGEPAGYDFNQTYLDAVTTFADAINGSSRPIVDGADSLKTLRLVLAAKQSALEHRECAP